jgi:hypothetical protein
MTLRSLALVSVVLTPFVLAEAGIAAAAKPSIRFTPNPVHAGAVVRVHGSAGGCSVGEAVTVLSRAFPHTHTFAGVPAVLAKVRPNGFYGKRVRIPLHRNPDSYRATARCGGGNFGIVSRLHVSPPRAASIRFTPNPVHAGAVVRVHGSAGGCSVGEAVTVLSRAFPHTHTFAGVPAVIATVRPNGFYGKRVRIPLQRNPDSYRATARCGGGNFGIVSRLHVSPA